MRTRHLVSLAALLALGLPAFAEPAVLRESPALTIVDPSGNAMPLASSKGQVAVIEFMLTRCQGCLRVAQTINKLYGEMGGQGFRPIGVAFDNGMNVPTLRNFVQALKINYPFGYTTSDQVDGYLRRAPTERLQVPQLVVIDRAGVIRSQSRPIGETDLTNENYLRGLVGELLKEHVLPGKTENTIDAPKSAGAKDR